MTPLDWILGNGDDVTLTMDKPRPDSLLDTTVQDVLGKPLDRVDGPKKVSGSATYAAEYQLDNLAYGVLVGSTIGKGSVRSIGTDAAKAMPGIIDVVIDFDTFARVAQQGGETRAPAQGVKQIDHVGQVIAIVVGETFEAARDAAKRIEIVYDREDGVFGFSTDLDRAKNLPDNNTPAQFSQGDLDAAMADAPVTIDETYSTPSQNSAAMEPHASIAVWHDDALTLYGAYQMPTSDAQQLAKALGLPADKVRIIAHYIGGGFGSKLGIAPESVAAAIAAKQLGRPVKAVMLRQQVFETTPRRSNTVQRMRLAAGADGKLTGIGHETITSNLADQDYFEPAGLSTHFLYAGENRVITHDLVRINWGPGRLHARAGRGRRPARPRGGHGRAGREARHRPDRAAPHQRAGAGPGERRSLLLPPPDRGAGRGRFPFRLERPREARSASRGRVAHRHGRRQRRPRQPADGDVGQGRHRQGRPRHRLLRHDRHRHR